MRNILLINDMPSHGKVALAAMNPIFSYYGHQTYNLPTILISNTFNYKKYALQDNLNYMKSAYEVYQQLDIQFDVLCSGYIASDLQRDWIVQVFKANTGFKVVDPIMADNGKLYSGLSIDIVEQMKTLCQHADLIIPNYTEALLLADNDVVLKTINDNEAKELIEKLKALTTKSIIITSVPFEDKFAVYGYCHIKNMTFSLTYDVVETKVMGTGDMFSAVLISQLLATKDLKKSAHKAMEFLFHVISLHQKKSSGKPLFIEQYLDHLD